MVALFYSRLLKSIKITSTLKKFCVPKFFLALVVRINYGFVHTKISGQFTASTSTASQNFNTYVIFDAKFDGLVQISDFLRAIE